MPISWLYLSINCGFRIALLQIVDTFCSGVESFKIYFMSTASISREHCRDIFYISYSET